MNENQEIQNDIPNEPVDEVHVDEFTQYLKDRQVGTELVEQVAPEGENDESSESSADEESVEKEEVPEQKPKKGIEKRFSELTEARKQAEARAEELQKRLDALESKQKDIPQPKAETPLSNDKPKMADYYDIESYQEALVDWKLQQKELKAQAEVKQREANDQAKAVVDTWTERENAAKAKVEGYDIIVNQDFIGSFTKIASQESMQYLLESEHGPEMLYALAEDDDLLKDFQKMSKVKQVAMLAKMESKFVPEEKVIPVKKESSAPKPVKPLAAGKGTAGKIDATKGFDSFTDYQKWRNQTKKK